MGLLAEKLALYSVLWVPAKDTGYIDRSILCDGASHLGASHLSARMNEFRMQSWHQGL